jgi:hypothetical protein
MIVGLVAGSVAFVALLLTVGGIEPRDRARISDLLGTLRAKVRRRA